MQYTLLVKSNAVEHPSTVNDGRFALRDDKSIGGGVLKIKYRCGKERFSAFFDACKLAEWCVYLEVAIFS